MNNETKCGSIKLIDLNNCGKHSKPIFQVQYYNDIFIS